MAKSTVTKDQRVMLDRLAEAGGRLTAEEDIVFQGSKLIVPEKMNLSDAVRFLEEKIAEDERHISFSRTFKYRPWDGARATAIAMKKAFGIMVQRSTPGMFGPEPPSLITIDVGVNEQDQVPWGALGIPLMPGATMYLQTSGDPEFGPVFQVEVDAPRKYRFHIEGLFRLIEDELEYNSMYRGKAFDGQTMPRFLDLRGFDRNRVVYSQSVVQQLEANIWSVLKYSDQMKDLGIPLKRAVLFEGPYGTGKTLGATWTATIAQDHGWTFIQCRPDRDDMNEVMQTARLYQPCVVFFEDVDTIASAGEDSDQVTRLLDMFDGIQAKDTRIVVVLTTNHVERIHKGMMRPGRMDAVIHIGELDRDGFEKLVRVTVPEGKLGEVDYDRVAEAFKGFLPAFAKEAIDRAMRYNLTRNQGNVGLIETEDLVSAAEGLRPQLQLMEDAKESVCKDTIEERIGKILDGAEYNLYDDRGQRMDDYQVKK